MPSLPFPGPLPVSLDDEASWADGLAQVVAVALADPGAPLAVVAGDGQVRGPAAEMAPLLWGLCRIIRPLLGTVRRGWSFSTFELPLDSADPQPQPDIVFRAAGGLAAGPPPRSAARPAASTHRPAGRQRA